MISIRDLGRTYRTTGVPVIAVRDASLDIRAGDFISIVGHSGSGKSTLLSMIGGILRPDSGTVTVEGEDIWTYSDDRLAHLRNARFAFIYQFASLIPTLTIEENVLLPTIFGGTAVLADAERLIEMVGLQNKIGRYPSELSGGEQQRVAIARAFINSPGLVLADEPTGDLDEETETEIIRLFERINQDKRTTFIMVTHNKDIAGRASRRFSMRNGVIEELS